MKVIFGSCPGMNILVGVSLYFAFWLFDKFYQNPMSVLLAVNWETGAVKMPTKLLFPGMQIQTFNHPE
jgi:hypothetical protein